MTTGRTWRRALARIATLSTLAISVAAVTTPVASADALSDCRAAQNRGATIMCDGPVHTSDYAVAPLGYQGWTYLNLNYCAPGLMCSMVYRASTPAWRWTGTRWVSTSLGQGWAYVYPYSGSWRWAWTSATGWVAINGGRFEFRPKDG